MNNKIYKYNKKFENDLKNFGTLEHRGQWLVRLGLGELVQMMIDFSEKVHLPWADHWIEHLDDPEWLSRAMANTFVRMGEKEKERIRPLYEYWMWYARHFDMNELVHRNWWAQCYVLNEHGRRLRWQGESIKVNKVLTAQTQSQALSKLDKSQYEFIRWL